MIKGIVIALGSLLLLGASLAHAQEIVPRYRVTYVKNFTAGGANETRVATVITVVNQSSNSCSARIDWVRNDGTLISRTGPLPIPAGGAAQFCSRPLGPGVSTCSLLPGVALPASFTGTAIVASAALPSGCELIAVEARVYHLGTPADGNQLDDMIISGISNSRVVFIGEANLGD